MSVQHYVSVSGGADSLATYLLALERGMPFRALGADVGNEDERWEDYVRSISRITGGPEVEIVRADFSDRFEERRAAIRRDWPNELRRKKHTNECRAKPYAERKTCGCPETVLPPVPDHLIEQACAVLYPTGNPFLDLCMLKGRFPGAKSRFCTEELKLVPIQELERVDLEAGRSIITWLGERAEESPGRAAKPTLEWFRWAPDRMTRKALYRPIHSWTKDRCFEIAKRHGVPPNPLYLEGMNRVGCSTCIMATKDEIAEWSLRFPQHVAKIREWERIVSLTSRRGSATFFCAKTVPGTEPDRASIDKAVSWSQTGRGGRQYDMLLAADRAWADENGVHCKSSYGLCE